MRLNQHIKANQRGTTTSNFFVSMTAITACETASGVMINLGGDLGWVSANSRLKFVSTGPGQTTETSMPNGLSS